MPEAQRREEEPGNQTRPATMPEAQRREEEPGNQTRPATMPEAQRREEEPGLAGADHATRKSLLGVGAVLSTVQQQCCLGAGQ
jgi:hypothetical protein